MLLYRLIMALALPVVLIRLLWQGERYADLAERLGRGRAGASGPTLWLHGASNGELASARWLIEALLASRPGLHILVTSNTRTARQMVQAWHLPGVTAALAPIDVVFAARCVLRRWRPKAMVSLEAELWPTRLALCAASDIPVLVIGARMSARAHRGWRHFAGLARTALSAVRFASAQDGLSRQRLIDLGLLPAASGPDFDLKAQAVACLPEPVIPPRAARESWLLAASTHAGEDAVILDAFAASPFSHLILAPRHPSRAAEIARLLAQRGLNFAQRSRGAGPDDATVLLADTLGEMDLWYARCGACVIGGTLVDKGGHTPWEPARQHCAILHGPHVSNFAAAFATLDGAGGALAVTQDTLAATLAMLDAPSQDRLAGAAYQILRNTGDSSALLATILTISRL